MNYFHFSHVDKTVPSVCGCAMLNPGWSHMSRTLENDTVLIIGKKNRASITCCGLELEVKPGRMILLPAGEFHFGTRKIQSPASYYWFHFCQCENVSGQKRFYAPHLMEEKEALTILSSPAIAYERLCDSIILPQSLNLKNTSSVTRMCSDILCEYQKPSFSSLVYRIKLINLLLELSGECFNEDQPFQKSGGTPSIVRQLIVMMEDELSNADASVKFFADRMNVNADYLGRIFKNAMHIPVGQYIARRRVELACTRLRESSERIDDIFVQCGFGSRRQFYEEFSRITGKTPRLYRDECAFMGINSL